MEFDLAGRLHFLAPEPVEGRELGVLETGDVHALVELERGGDRLADHHVALAQGQAEEHVVRRHGAGLLEDVVIDFALAQELGHLEALLHGLHLRHGAQVAEEVVALLGGPEQQDGAVKIMLGVGLLIAVVHRAHLHKTF